MIRERLVANSCLRPSNAGFFAQQLQNPNYYHQSVLLSVNESLDLPLMEEAFGKLVRHHDTLRINVDKEGPALFITKIICQVTSSFLK